MQFFQSIMAFSPFMSENKCEEIIIEIFYLEKTNCLVFYFSSGGKKPCQNPGLPLCQKAAVLYTSPLPHQDA